MFVEGYDTVPPALKILKSADKHYLSILERLYFPNFNYWLY